MSSWGPGTFENDAAIDWFASVERHGWIAIVSPMLAVSEFGNRGHSIPIDAELAFWAMCEVIAAAGGSINTALSKEQLAKVKPIANKLLALPEVETRIRRSLQCLYYQETELELLWQKEEGVAFREVREDIYSRLSPVLNSLQK